ncbi:MAG: WD40 repeat domain-containing protein [Halobacteria archaeon]|nr:WD40 repeat domain-containing protein [Halobacteria archaeon]
MAPDSLINSGCRTLVLLALGLLPACAARPIAEPADIIHEQAHSGGSVVAFSQSGDRMVSGGWEGVVQLWRLPDGERVSRWRAHDDSVNGLAFVAGDRRVLTAGYDGVLVEWSLGGKPLRRIQTPAPVTHMVASAPHDRVLTGHGDGSVRVWRLADLELIETWRRHQGGVKAVAMDPQSLRYASSGSDGAVFIWDEAGAVRTLERPPTDAWSLVFSPDGGHLYGGTWFRLLRWDLGDGALTRLPTAHRGIIRSLQFTGGGATLASISRQTDSAVYFIDPQSGAVTRRFQKHDLCGAAVAVSPRGRYLATTSDDASVRIWALQPDD